MDKKIKILVGYHKPATLLKSEIFEPIHLGRALATEASKDGKMSQEDYQWMLDNMIGDDIGDNISHLNRELCELTGLYWAWKNYDKLGDPDYIGFMHYRRLLSFSADNFNVCNGEIWEPLLDENSLKKYKINQEFIQKEMQTANIICGMQIKHSKNVYEQFQDLEIPRYGLDSKIFYDVLQICREDFPEYSDAIDTYSQSKSHYWYNCFVMKKEYFNELCNFLFTVLLKIQPMIDYSKYNINGQRVLAYISERLIGIYITNLLLKDKEFPIKHLPIVFFNNTETYLTISPCVREQKTIVFSVDNNYIPYLSVTIKSLINNVSAKNYYAIYILETDISDSNKRKIKLMETDNVKIKFISIKRFLKNVDNSIFYLCDHFSISTYFRFFIPQLFKNFDKLIYCDCDAIFLKDPAELFDIELQDNWLGVVHDTEVIKQIFTNKKDTYYIDKLKLKKPQNYFQAGFLLMNIPKLLEVDFENKCIEKLKEIKTPRYVDQCILNSVCEDKVLFLDARWNVENHLMVFDLVLNEVLPYQAYCDYMKGIMTPFFLHYSGTIKPWNHQDIYNAELWWQYARYTPFYEMILHKNLILNINTVPNRITYSNFIQRIFSMKNYKIDNKTFKVVTILGVRIKFKRRKK